MIVFMRNVFKLKTWLFVAYLAAATAALLVLVELALAGLDKVTGGKIPLLAASDYPSDEEAHYKIAVVGESTAWRHGVERSFVDMVYYELTRLYPHKRFYLKNYARPGAYFHGYQAEIAKANIGRYDLLIICAGHNEALTFLDPLGFFRKPEFKEYRQVGRLPGDDLSALGRLLDYHSRLYAIVARRKNAAISEKIREAGGMEADIVFPEFAPESRGLVPPADRPILTEHYRNDIEDIARRAERAGTRVLVLSPVGNQLWPPCFSLLGEAQDPSQRRTWSEAYQSGIAEMGRQNFSGAIPHLLKAYAIDQRVAIVNFALGKAYRALGDKEESRRFLRLASDTDGHLARAPLAFGSAAREVAATTGNLRFVDSVELMEKMDDHGYDWNQTFIDIHHPSTLGHAALALTAVVEIAKMPGLGNGHSLVTPLDRQTADVNPRLVEEYRNTLHISAEEEADAAFQRAKWFLMFSGRSAYPERFFSRAEQDLAFFREKAGQGKADVEDAFAQGLEILRTKRASRAQDKPSLAFP